MNDDYLVCDIEKKRAQKRAEYQKHKASYIERAKKWAEANPEKRKAIIKKHNNLERTKLRKREWHESKMFGLVGIERTSCEMCGTSPGEIRNLVIHHADGNNGKLGKKLNNSPDNLVVLCRVCHPKVHYKGTVRILT